jgi:hypothetical protein
MTLVQAAVSLDNRGHPEYVKMKIMKNLKEETAVEFVEERIREGSVINTDGYSSYAAAFADRAVQPSA